MCARGNGAGGNFLGRRGRAPIAIALGLTAFLYFFYFTTVPLTQVPERLFSALNTFPLMAIPFLVLAATIMSRGGISRRLTDLGNAAVGQFRGGLAMTAVLACMFFAAVSGSSPATVVALGTLLIPGDGHVGLLGEVQHRSHRDLGVAGHPDPAVDPADRLRHHPRDARPDGLGGLIVVTYVPYLSLALIGGS